MLANYLTFAFRILLKNKFYAFLNLVGLAVGIACSLLILLYVQDDLTYDQHHRNHKRIYRITANYKLGDNHYAVTSPVLGPMLQEDYPGDIEKVVRFQGPYPNMLLKTNEEQFYEDHIYCADSTVFEVFTHPFRQGDPRTSLREKNSIVLTEKLARRYFGEENPMGQLLEVNGTLTKVTGVMENVAPNSHLTFDALLPYSNLPQPSSSERLGQLWGISDYTYLLLAANHSIVDLQNKFSTFYDKYMAKPAQAGKNVEQPAFKAGFQPLSAIHFDNASLQYDRPIGNSIYLYAFIAIGLSILVLAAINYMNLATARWASRSKEVGMRKVLGTTQEQLMIQFLGESMLLAFLSLLLAICSILIILKLTPFNELVQKSLSADFIHNPVLLVGSLGITLLIGLAAGLYPAFYLSAIPPIAALKRAVNAGMSGVLLRKGLVLFQFSISIGIFICTLVMSQQIDYLRGKELGFQKENVLLVDVQDTLMAKQMNYLKSELLKNPNVVGATTAIEIPGGGLSKIEMPIEGKDGPEKTVLNLMQVGEDYLKTMGMQLVEGRDFDPARPKDLASAIIINQAMARQLGWQQPLNKKIGEQRVIGVVKDFNSHSLHEPIAPMAIDLVPNNFGTLHLRLSRENLPQTLAFIEKKWTELGSKRPFQYRFLDESLNKLYASDEQQSHLFGILTLICAFISLLGLLGLSSFTVTQRTKEIGIRKVLGASVSQIIYLMVKEVLLLVLIAGIVASPLAYYLSKKWLQDFAYQTRITPVMFILAGLLALLFAFLTVSFHAIRAAQANPVHSLKHE